MSIVKMKRLRLIGMRQDREELLQRLQKLGCVDIREPEIDLGDPAWAALAKPDAADLSGAKEQQNQFIEALSALQKYAPAKGGFLQGRPEVSAKAFFDEDAYKTALQSAQDILDAVRQLAGHQAEQGKLQSRKASLAPWLALNVPLEYAGGDAFSVAFATIPIRADFAAMEAAVGETTELCELIPAGSDREQRYFLLVCHKSVEGECVEVLRPFGYAQANLRGWTGTAADNDRLLDNQLAALARKIEEDKALVVSYAGRRLSLQQALDRATQEVDRAEARGRLVDTEGAFLLDGWFPAEDQERLSALLGQYTCAWEATDPTEEEIPQVPVQLKDGRVSRCMNAITEMYSLPAYDGIDPNPLMAPFFIVFYGMMMADMAYGILMVLGTGIYLKKVKPKNPYFMEMFFWSGISTFIWGAMTGGFLGDFFPQIVKIINPNTTFAEMPALFTPLGDTVAIMVGSLVLGAIQVFTGMAVSVWYKSKNGNFLDALFDEITWWIILAGLGCWIVGMLVIPDVSIVGTIGLGILIVGALMLVFGGTRNEKGFGKVTGLVGIIYNGVTGFFSDILSYVRLMALMLAGSVIASVFNTLGATTGNVIIFIVISLIGNSLNLALNLLGCYVHDLRLQCLEFFGRFYKEGGKPYKPLMFATKYVDIKEEV